MYSSKSRNPKIACAQDSGLLYFSITKKRSPVDRVPRYQSNRTKLAHRGRCGKNRAYAAAVDYSIARLRQSNKRNVHRGNIVRCSAQELNVTIRSASADIYEFGTIKPLCSKKCRDSRMIDVCKANHKAQALTCGTPRCAFDNSDHEQQCMYESAST